MRISLGYQVVLAILLGIAVGLLFGPYSSVLDPIGEIFFMLLQMVILPYLLFLLVHGLGSLSPDIAKKLFRSGWIFFVLLWLVGFVVVYCLAVLVPTPQLIFVAPLTSKNELAMNLLSYLIPKNIFYDLSNNIVPAITISGLIAGLALMHLEKKDAILDVLGQANACIEKILLWLAKLSPIAIFSHVAVAAGTVQFENLAKVELSILVVIIATLFLTFWFLPALITSMTDLSYKDVMKELRAVCLIPFATAMPSLSFPFIYQSIRRLAQRHKLDNEQFLNTSQTVLPLSFAFGQLGNFFILFFIYFLSYYTHHALTSAQQLMMLIFMLPLSFGTVFSSLSSISFLIDKFHFPQEANKVFWTVSSITMHFQVLLSVACVLTLIILVLSAYYGLIKIKWNKLIKNLVALCGVFVLFIAVTKPFIHFQDNFTYLYGSLRLAEAIKNPTSATVYMPGQSIPPSPSVGLPVFERVLNSRVLRVGYFFMDTPFCYFNRFGELVGYDVAFAHQLAADLGCALEFIPIDIRRLGEQLNNGEFDVAMSGVLMTEERLTKMDFVKPNLELNNILIVPAKKKEKFVHLEDVVAKKDLKMGAFPGAYASALSHNFPQADYVELQTLRPLIDGAVDAVLWSYLSAFIWCLNHPEFTIIDYEGRLGKHFASYAVKSVSYEWEHFLQNWLILKDESGFTSKMYEYWVLGRLPDKQSPRWSIFHYFFPHSPRP